MTPDRVWSIQPPLPGVVRSALLFGGAFDPPHRAHVELPEEARLRAGLDWLVYLPAGRPPLKEGPAADARHRLAMLRLATQDLPRASVCDVEIEGPGLSYTVDTLRELTGVIPDSVSLRLLIGADQAAKFHEWKEPEAIIELAEPLVMLRPPLETADDLLQRVAPHWSSAEAQRWRDRVVDVPVIDVSSTEIRGALRDIGPDAPRLRGLIPAAVLEYIGTESLYRNS